MLVCVYLLKNDDVATILPPHTPWKNLPLYWNSAPPFWLAFMTSTLPWIRIHIHPHIHTYIHTSTCSIMFPVVWVLFLCQKHLGKRPAQLSWEDDQALQGLLEAVQSAQPALVCQVSRCVELWFQLKGLWHQGVLNVVTWKCGICFEEFQAPQVPGPFALKQSPRNATATTVMICLQENPFSLLRRAVQQLYLGLVPDMPH